MKTRNTAEFQRQASKIVADNVILDVNEILRALVYVGYIDEDTVLELYSDDQGNEILEHWHISPWLAAELRQEGEKVVVLEHLNLIVWGRTTSGQAISVDHALEQITERAVNEA